MTIFAACFEQSTFSIHDDPGGFFCDSSLPSLAKPSIRAVAAGGDLLFTHRAGPSLLTSSYLARREPLRIIAWLATRAHLDTAHAAAHHRGLQSWLARLGGEPASVDPDVARTLVSGPPIPAIGQVARTA